MNQLPGELKLSQQLGVSRSTLRQALNMLRDEGILIAHQGKNTLINARESCTSFKNTIKEVNLLAPFPLEKMPNYVIFWIDHLRSQLHETGLSLNLHAGKIFYKQQTGDALYHLVNQYPQGCWILAFSKPSIQKWFQEQQIPSIIAGFPEPGIQLPSIAIDHEAIIFHAIGRLTSRGHHKIALLVPGITSPGLDIFIASFKDTCQKMGSKKIDGQIITLKEENTHYVGRQLLSALKHNNCPTALIIINPFHTIHAFSFLPENGIRIPRDLSIVTTYGDRHLEYLSPTPSHYRFDPTIYTRKMFECIHKLKMGSKLYKTQFKIMPDPIPGESVALPSS